MARMPHRARTRIEVAPVDAALAEAVGALAVAPGEHGFVGDVAFNLADALRDPMGEAMAVLADGAVVGFYRLDLAPHAVAGSDLGEPAIGLRALLIDRERRGHGYGVAALDACCRDLRLRHPDRHVLAIAVHCCNRPAVATYARAGFRDTGRRLPGGPAGPQQLMLRRLRDAADAATSARALRPAIPNDGSAVHFPDPTRPRPSPSEPR